MATQTAKRGSRADDDSDGQATLAELSKHTARIGGELDELGDTAREIVESCRSLVRDRLRRQPYAVLATAVGVGYVLGGGLPRGALRALVLVGGRLALESAMARVTAGFTERR